MAGPLTIIRNLPVTVRVPLLVASLMFAAAGIISQQVLERLSKTQTEHLSGLASAYLDGLSAAVAPHLLRKDIWEVFDVLDRSKGKYQALHPVETIIADEQNIIIASSIPRKLASQARVPAVYTQRFASGVHLLLDAENQRAYARRTVENQNRTAGTIYATLDIAHLMAERRSVFHELVLTNLALTLFLAGIGYLAIRRMLKPVKILADHLEHGEGGLVEPIPPELMQPKHSEFGRLFRNFNGLAKAVHERADLTDRLAREERLASLGRLASGMAHEINNPLGGLFNAVDTMKKHGGKAAIRKSSLSLLERGLSGIRDVVSAALATYRPERNQKELNTRDIDDVALLVQPELRRHNITMDWRNLVEGDVPVQAAPVRQIVLNLLLNAVAASPKGSRVAMRAAVINGTLQISIADSGSGLPRRAARFLTGKTDGAAPVVEGSGMGLWMVQRLCQEINAEIQTAKSALGGTSIKCTVSLTDNPEVLGHAA